MSGLVGVFLYHDFFGQCSELVFVWTLGQGNLVFTLTVAMELRISRNLVVERTYRDHLSANRPMDLN